MPQTLTMTTGRATPAAVLLHRRGTVYPPAGGQPSALGEAGVTLLEVDLLDRGYLLSAPLRDALIRLGVAELHTSGTALLREIDSALGADRRHVPLFRGFPDTTPHDTLGLWVDRVITVLVQRPEQPCVLCGTFGTVHPVAPCAHLVCRQCFDGADYSACPICHRAIDETDPFLRPARRRPAAAADRAVPQRLRVLPLGHDLVADAGSELAGLLARGAALSPQDADDLTVLLETRDRGDLTWLPLDIPGRATKARVLAWLGDEPGVLPAVEARLSTATDVLRLLVARCGSDPGLTDIPRMGPVPRRLRRTLLGALDRLPVEQVLEDMLRYRRAWLHVGEALHPGEYAERFPRAAAAFAALRGTDPRALSATVREALTDGGGRRVAPWPTLVETALAAGDVAGAVALLQQRPGRLLRRADHLLRLSGTDEVEEAVAALGRAAETVAPAVLLSTLGALRVRAGARPARVFFPKSGRPHVVPEERAPLPAELVERVAGVLTGAVLARTGRLGPVDVALLDADLQGIPAPFNARSASRSLVALPRGSQLPIPAGRTVRLFVHWMESDASGVADLDLSAALFSAEWEQVGLCDYTRLRATGAVHSGDRTSAPAPAGASEFIDLDLTELGSAGVRYVVATVLSYNDVAFDVLADAFAGVMVRDTAGQAGAVFDARAVEQRYDLTGRARVNVPMVLDVQARTMRWLDVARSVTGTNHNVARHADKLALLGSALTGLFDSGARVTLGEIATWHAAARARTVLVRHGDEIAAYVRRDGESEAGFAVRIGTADADEVRHGPGDAGLAFLLRGDVQLPDGAEVFALHPGSLDPGKVRLTTAAADVVAGLAA